MSITYASMTIAAVEAKWGQPVVAVIYDSDNNVYDHAFNWQTGQSFALDGYKVVAVKADSIYSIDDLQRLFDAEKVRHDDCFGVIA